VMSAASSEDARNTEDLAAGGWVGHLTLPLTCH
jgi:hypothetical protein